MQRTEQKKSVLLWTILALAWPTMLEQILQTAVQYIDTAMVGTLGTGATAAVGATTTLNWLITGSVAAFGVGFLSYVSQAKGAGDMQRVRRVSMQASIAVLLLGSAVTVLALSLSPVIPALMQVDPGIRKVTSRYFFILYAPMLARTASVIFGALLRGTGDTKTPMRAGVVTNVLNVILNALFIYKPRTVHLFSLAVRLPGAGLGVTGAALASAVSFVAGGLLITLALLRHPLLSPLGLPLKPDRAILAPCMKVALPNMLQRFVTSLGYVVFAAMINALGQASTAAHTIANTVEAAFYIPGYGMQAAAATLTGMAIGADDMDTLKKEQRIMLLLEFSLMLFSGVMLFVFAPHLIRLFSRDPGVTRLSSTVLRMVACSEPLYGIPLIVEGFLQGAGRTRISFLFNLIGMWGIRITGTFLCTVLFGMGLVSAWSCMILHNVILFFLFLSFYLRKRNMLFDRGSSLLV